MVYDGGDEGENDDNSSGGIDNNKI